MAGSSSTLTTYENVGTIRKIVVDWVADDSDGSIPTQQISLSGRLILLRTNPGSTAPTDNYDITLVDGNSIDQLQGVGANRDTANTEEELITYSGTSIHPVIRKDQPLTLTFANNSVNDATGSVELIYEYIQQ